MTPIESLFFDFFFFFFFNDTATTEIYTLSLHDALPLWARFPKRCGDTPAGVPGSRVAPSEYVVARSEEHTSELQSPCNLVCRLLLEKKNRTELKQRRRQLNKRKNEE